MNASTKPPSDDGLARVLIVEEDPLLRQLFEMEALDLGCRVECAATGADAIDALTSYRYDVVLVDARIGKPDLRGLIAAGRAVQPETRFVTVIRFHERERFSNAMALSPFACLQVPFTPGALHSVFAFSLRKTRNGGAGPIHAPVSDDDARPVSSRLTPAMPQSAAGSAKP